MRYTIKTTPLLSYVVDPRTNCTIRSGTAAECAEYAATHEVKTKPRNAFLIARDLKKMGLGDLGILPKESLGAAHYLRHNSDKS